MVLINKTGLARVRERRDILQNMSAGVSDQPQIECYRCKLTGVQAILVLVLEALPGISCNMQIVNLVLDISGAA